MITPKGNEFKRNEAGNQVITGSLSFASMEEAYLSNTFGYSEPDQLLASGKTYDKVRNFLIQLWIDQRAKVPEHSPRFRFIFHAATLIQDETIPEGEIHFAVKGLDNPHRLSILKLEEPLNAN